MEVEVQTQNIISLTPEMIAKCFCEATEEEQRDILLQISYISAQWLHASAFQWSYIARSSNPEQKHRILSFLKGLVDEMESDSNG